MTRVNFEGPISQGKETGVPTTDTRGFVKVAKQVLVNATDKAVNVLIPAKSTITGLGGVLTSAISGAGADSTSRFSFSDGTKLLGSIGVSGLVTNYVSTLTNVSAATIDSETTITVALSAQATSVFTGGGGRAFIEFITVE